MIAGYMKAIISTGQILSRGKQLEQAGQLEEAASVYQRAVDVDPENLGITDRLFIVYRRLKEYDKELAAINAVLAAYDRRDKLSREKWLKEHPKAVSAGKAVLRKLGGVSASAFGTEPTVKGLLKRKAFVEKRMAGGNIKDGKKPAEKAKMKKAEAAATRKRTAEERKREVLERKQEEQERMRAARERKREAQEQKRAAHEQKQAAAAARKEAAAQRKRETSHPSLFVILIRYMAPIEKIDAAMEEHVGFLDKFYIRGNFLVSGRQVPRTGGIIIARGKDRAAVEKIMTQDPFVKKKLAVVDIVEFLARRTGKAWEQFLPVYRK
jgi:uncharacterized protein YciI